MLGCEVGLCELVHGWVEVEEVVESWVGGRGGCEQGGNSGVGILDDWEVGVGGFSVGREKAAREV